MPSLVGRRLTVWDIVTKIYYEPTLKEAIDDYEITFLEAKTATDYCIELRCKEEENRINFCDGCILRTIEEGWDFKREEFTQVNEKLTISKDGNFIFLGTIDELGDQTFGKLGWVFASEILHKFNENAGGQI